MIVGGEYTVVITDDHSKELKTIDRTASSGHPQTGSEIPVGGDFRTVYRVRHVPDPDDRTSREYTVPLVFVREREGPARRPSNDKDCRVVPFRSTALDADTGSAIFPPMLIAMIVARGYRDQATEFRARMRIATQLAGDGKGWFAEDTPDELWRLSRLAKRYFLEAEFLIAEMGRAADAAAFSARGSFCAPDLRRAPSPTPLSAPALRLV